MQSEKYIPLCTQFLSLLIKIRNYVCSLVRRASLYIGFLRQQLGHTAVLKCRVSLSCCHRLAVRIWPNACILRRNTVSYMWTDAVQISTFLIIIKRLYIIADNYCEYGMWFFFKRFLTGHQRPKLERRLPKIHNISYDCCS